MSDRNEEMIGALKRETAYVKRLIRAFFVVVFVFMPVFFLAAYFGRYDIMIASLFVYMTSVFLSIYLNLKSEERVRNIFGRR